MNTPRLSLIPLLAASTLTLTLTSTLTLAGCDDSEEITATASESQSESEDTSSTGEGGETDNTGPTTTAATTEASTSATATSTSGSDTDGTEGTGTQASESEDTGPLLNCGDAQDADDCEGIEFAECQWFATATPDYDYANETCVDLGPVGGRCIAVEIEGSQCPLDLSPNCDDGGTVLYRDLGEVGDGVEVLKLEPGSVCEFPEGMQVCQLNSDPSPGSIPTFSPGECSCLCDVPG